MAQSAIIAVPESTSSTKNKYEFHRFYFYFWKYHSPTHNCPTVGNFKLRNSGKIRKTVDAMSTMSGVSSSGKYEPDDPKDRGG